MRTCRCFLRTNTPSLILCSEFSEPMTPGQKVRNHRTNEHKWSAPSNGHDVPNLDQPIEVGSRRGGPQLARRNPSFAFERPIVGAIARPPRYSGEACRPCWRNRGMMMESSGQAIVSVACKMADIWPFDVKMFAPGPKNHSFCRIVTLFPRTSTFPTANPTRVECFGCGAIVLHKTWAKKTWIGQGRIP